MSKRPIIEINRKLCNGCGLCTTACAEGALVLDKENKAVLVKEIFCDGLGACLNVCPTGALKVVEKDTADYDPQASYEHVKQIRGPEAAKQVHGFEELSEKPALGCGLPGEVNHRLTKTGCPGSMARELKPSIALSPQSGERDGVRGELSQWPIQLHLVSPQAPYFEGCDLLIAADCTAFTIGSFHQDLLKGKKLVIACPKLDDTENYVAKIAEILKNNTIYSLTVAIMTVPCCSGMYRIVQEAVSRCGKNIAIRKIVIGLDGEILK